MVVGLVIASVAIFALLEVLPGSPAQVILGTQATPAAVHALSAKLGLDRPLVGQYWGWARGLLEGRLGTSYISGQAIWPEMSAALSVSGPLVGFGLVIGLVLGVVLGVLAGLGHDRFSGVIVTSISQIGIAVPGFVLAIVLLIVFGEKLSWFPAGGFPGWSTSVSGSLRSLVLPGLALGFAEASILSRYVRAGVIEVLESDYLRTAMANGLRKRQALWRHGRRNAAAPLLTVFGLQFGGLVVGAVVVESVFTLPGIGTLLISALDTRDLSVVADVVMIVVATVLVVNMAVDIAHRLLDPRIGTHA